MRTSPLFFVLAPMLLYSLTLALGCATQRSQSAAGADARSQPGASGQVSERGKREGTGVLPRQFETLTERARAARSQPYVAPREAELPDSLRNIDWATYRTIRFRPERALWQNQPGHFEAQFFHLGFIYRTPVMLYAIEGDRTEALPFSTDRFSYDGVPAPQPNLALGYGGLRLHTNLNSEAYRDETIVFQGASYFRSLGRGNAFGLSARALAVDTGESTPEEFPRFSELYLVRPTAEQHSIWVLGLIDSQRVTGACAFLVTPADAQHAETRVEVTLELFFRQPVAVLGLAPFSSMYLFGEAAPHRFDSARPEVHDSDGLAFLAPSGERTFRPLDNPARTRLTQYRLDSPRGFGLLQRDRAPDSYQDANERYHQRPSAWVEPIGDWGTGQLRLLEIATSLESDDNVATLWVPDQVPREGLRVQYRLSFGSDLERAPFGRAVATRFSAQGVGETQFTVDFDVPHAEAVALPVQLVLTTPGAKVLSQDVQREPHSGGFRAQFELSRDDANEQAELRAFLRSGSDVLTETWSYPWQVN